MALLGWLAGWLCSLLSLVHGGVVLPMGQWAEIGLQHGEESTKAFIRETFSVMGRCFDGAGAWVLSVVDASYADAQRRTWRQQQAWQHWWREDRTSTLNVIVANAQPAGLAASGSLGGSRPASASGGPMAPASRLRRSLSLRTAALPPPPEPLSPQKAPPQRASEPSGAQPRGWSLGGLLRSRASTGGGGAPAAGAAAQGPLAHASSAPALARPAGRDAGRDFLKRREERTAAFDAAGWWGVHEALNRKGLLEDLRLALELAVTRVFDGARWLLRALTLAPVPRARRAPRGGPGGVAAAVAAAPRRPRVAKPSSGDADAGPLQLRGRRAPRVAEEHAAVGPCAGGKRGAAAGAAATISVSAAGCEGWVPGAADGLLSTKQGAHAKQQHEEEEAEGRGKGTRLAGRSPPPPTKHGHAHAAAPSAGAAALDAGGGDEAGRGRPQRRGFRSRSFSGLESLADESHAGRAMTKLRRTRSVGRFDHTPWAMPWEDGGDWGGDELHFESPTAHVIRMAGYPLETYTVVTEDGYVLRMERIPRPGAPDVALFVHGILDTSLTWVSAGVTGSQAFAAWDQGFDVWLASSRSNPPRVTTDPSRQGMGYWRYTINELGIYDMAAQVDKLHEVKTQELGGRDPRLDMRYAGDLAGTPPTARAAHAAAGAGPFSRLSTPAHVATSAPVRARGGGGAGGGAGVGHVSGGSGRVSGEALFGGHGVVAGPAPRRLGMQRSFSDQALLSGPLLSPQASRGGSGGGGSGADAAAGERRARGGLGAWLRRGKGRRRQSPARQRSPDRRARPGSSGGGASSAGGSARGGSIGVARAPQGDQMRQKGHADGAAAASDAKPGCDNWAGAQAQPEQQPRQQQQQPQKQRRPLSALAATIRGAFSRRSSAADDATPDSSRHGPQPMSPDLAAAAALQVPPDGGAQQQWGSHLATPATAPVPVPPARHGGAGAGQRTLCEPSTPEVVEGPLAALEPGAAGRTHAARRSGSSPSLAAADARQATPFLREGTQAAVAAALEAGAAAAAAVAASAAAAGAVAAAGAAWGASPARGGSGGGAASPLPSQAPLLGASSSGMRRVHSSQAVFTLARAASSGASLASCGGGGGGGTVAPARAGSGASRATAGSPSASSQASAAADAAAFDGSAAAGRGPAAAAAADAPLAPPVHQARRQAEAPEPYNLRVVAHSLGGASMLIYLVMRLRSGRPHRVKRLVLLTPAGFHPKLPWVFWPILKLAPYFFTVVRLMLGPGAAIALYLPTSAVRSLTFKFMLDIARLPALGALLRAFMRFSLNGDRSEWDRAAQLPHYNARAMPAVSFHQGLHFVQLWATGRFRLYDYGSRSANLEHYGHPAPPDIASEYWRLDMPVDICAGRHDGVIPPANVRRHVSAMRSAGVDVTYREFDFGHLDFTFNSKDELRYFVLSRLMKGGR